MSEPYVLGFTIPDLARLSKYLSMWGYDYRDLSSFLDDLDKTEAGQLKVNNAIKYHQKQLEELRDRKI